MLLLSSETLKIQEKDLLRQVYVTVTPERDFKVPKTVFNPHLASCKEVLELRIHHLAFLYSVEELSSIM